MINKDINPQRVGIWFNLVNVMAADALVPCVTRTSAAMTLTIWNKQVLVFQEKGFQLPVPYVSAEEWYEV